MKELQISIWRSISFWVLITISLNGIITFTYAALTWNDTTILWALLTVNLIFYTGITQSGIIFSTVMEITRAEWGKYFSRTGEIMTISSIPIAVITFILLYVGGIEHIFYRISRVSLQSFLWRNILTMTAFYSLSFIYLYKWGMRKKEIMVAEDTDRRPNIMASLVMISYVIANTNMAWDLMAIIPGWESTIFPPYFWAGNIFSGTAFLFIVFILFRGVKPADLASEKYLNPMGKLLLGYALLWVYMYWAQYFVIWYGDIPRLTEPLFIQMRENYSSIFLIMIIAAFIIPFMTLIQKRVRCSFSTQFIVVILICIGIWINRYLMIIPLFSDGSKPIVLTWTGISIILSGLAVTFLSVIICYRLTDT